MKIFSSKISAQIALILSGILLMRLVFFLDPKEGSLRPMMKPVNFTEEGGVVTGKTSPVSVATASDYPTRSSLTPGVLMPPINSEFVLNFSRKQTMKQVFDVFPDDLTGEPVVPAVIKLSGDGWNSCSRDK